MNIIRRRGWELPESQVTPEHLFFNRRSLHGGCCGDDGSDPVAATLRPRSA